MCFFLKKKSSDLDPFFYRYPATPSDDDSGKLVTEIPISVALTEFHFVLLYKDRVRAICQLNDQIVYEEMIPIVRYKKKLYRHKY